MGRGFDRHMRAALDEHITGHYGEDQDQSGDPDEARQAEAEIADYDRVDQAIAEARAELESASRPASNGFQSPNFTQTPNDLFDYYLPELGDAELRVVLAVCRATFGYHRQQARISLTDIQRRTGLSRQGAVDGARAAEARGLICRRQDGGVTIWAAVVKQLDQLVQPGDQPGAPASQAGGLRSIKDKSEQGKKKRTSARPPLDPAELAAANKKVDRLLDQERTAQARAGQSWRILPDPFWPLAQAFEEASGIKCRKSAAHDWLATISDWMSDGITPDLIRAAVESCRQQKLNLARPGSINFMLDILRREKKASAAEACPDCGQPVKRHAPDCPRLAQLRAKAAGAPDQSKGDKS